MILKILLTVIGILISCVSFFAIRWMTDTDKKLEAMQSANDKTKKETDSISSRVEKLEENSVVQRHCMDTVSLFSQKVNRERHRINAIEDLLRAGGLIQLVKNLRQRQNDTSEE